MIRKTFIGVILSIIFASYANAQMLGTGVGSAPCVGTANPCSFVLKSAGQYADVQTNFAKSLYYQSGTVYSSWSAFATAISATFSRACTGTGCLASDLLPSAASGASYSTYAANAIRIIANSGYLAEPTATNFLLVSNVPVTQTTGALANGTYTLWVNGSGSAAMSSGTATGCGTGVATNGIPVSFTTSGAAGTCIVTVTGALNAFQLEKSAYGTSFIVTGATTGVRAIDDLHYPLANAGDVVNWWRWNVYQVTTQGYVGGWWLDSSNLSRHNINAGKYAPVFVITGTTGSPSCSSPSLVAGTTYATIHSQHIALLQSYIAGITCVTVTNMGATPSFATFYHGERPSVSTAGLGGFILDSAQWGNLFIGSANTGELARMTINN